MPPHLIWWCWPRHPWAIWTKRGSLRPKVPPAFGKTTHARSRRSHRDRARSQDAGVSLTVGLNFRYLAATIEAKRIFAEKELGAPSFGQYLYWTNRDGRRPGINKYPLTMHQPMLYEQSIHHLDLFRFTYGAEVARVSAITHNPDWSMYADDANVFALVEMTNGIVVNYFGTWSGTTKLRTFEWRTDCSEGAVIQRDFFKDLAVVHQGFGRAARHRAHTCRRTTSTIPGPCSVTSCSRSAMEFPSRHRPVATT